MENKNIEEIRVNGEGMDSPIGRIGLNLGYLFLKYMGGNYSMGKEVNILGIQFSFEIESTNDNIEILFNHNNTYNLYYIHCTISKHYFNQLEDFEKIVFICQCVYMSLLEWAKKFNLPLNPIHDANKRIIEEEYFVEKKQKYKSKNKKYTCGIEYRNEYAFQTYRLIVEDSARKEKSYYFVCQKDYFRDDELMKTDILKWLDTPRDLKVTGWVSEKEFEMKWGDEKYIFDIDTKKIIKR
ncbi:hypothetical protein BPO_p0031 (plasmid) [Bergeyella porcorum]|uniref:Uncharacterized protein n=1 Tax=Bergeyella porcorum TaxID=1735111 RepID=A0AAU0F631_9FLAO